MSTITWFHLSDLHFRAGKQHTWDENIVLRALLEDVADRIEQDGLWPDFIVVTGDIAFSGKSEEYGLAQRFFDRLLEVTSLDKDRLFIVPGNHDVDRDLITQGAKGVRDFLIDRNSANTILSTPSERRLMLSRLNAYVAFITDYLGGHLQFDSENYFCVRTLELAGRQVAVIGLNSAWLAQGGDEDRGQLVLSERQVRPALDAAHAADLRLAVMHHPFEWLRDFDRSDVEPLLCKDCDLILHGHMHQVGLLQAHTPDTKAMLIAAGACYETRERPNSYNIVQLRPTHHSGVVHLRMYSDRQGGFWTKDVVNYRNVSDGVYEFVLHGEDVANRPMQPSDSIAIEEWSLLPAAQRVTQMQQRAPGHVQRCADLAQNMRDTLELIKEYEEQCRNSDDPRTKRRANRAITDLRDQLAGYEAEYRALGCEQGHECH